MKKMNAFITALTLAVTALTPLASFAADIELKSDNTTEVSKEYTSYYTINIPPTVQDIEVGTEFEVGATGFMHYNEKIIISVESKNEWKLKDKEFSENTKDVAYTMSAGEKVITAKDKDILEVAFSDNKQSGNVTMKVDSIAEPVYAGTYGDTLTFSARAVPIKEDAPTQAETPETPADDDNSGGETP